MLKIFILSLTYFLFSNIMDQKNSGKCVKIEKTDSLIISRFCVTEGYSRPALDSQSFGFYLRHLSLKPKGTLVKTYQGVIKENNGIYCAVVDLEIGNRDLQQCADAVMRLRAEYLFSKKKFADIKFKFVADNTWHDYLTYAKSDRTYAKFRAYLDFVFSYANTASLKKQLIQKPFKDINIGDVFVQSGNPYGHAVIVVDIASNGSGAKQFILAQSYMPAQDIQILQNKNDTKPWYDYSNKHNKIYTPEWTFDTADLRTW